VGFLVFDPFPDKLGLGLMDEMLEKRGREGGAESESEAETEAETETEKERHREKERKKESKTERKISIMNHGNNKTTTQHATRAHARSSTRTMDLHAYTKTLAHNHAKSPPRTSEVTGEEAVCF
jgi:hypothetical protein